MPYRRKATDEQIIEAYQRTGSVHKAGALLGMGGGSVHERLQKIGAVVPHNVFTEDDVARIKREYVAYADAGRLDELAAEMGRTKQTLCRKAGELGLTDQRRPKEYFRKWQTVGKDAARVIFDDYLSGKQTLAAFCRARGYNRNGVAALFTHHFEEEFDAAKEKGHTTGNWRYAAGRRFEYRVRDHLADLGAFVMRSPGSKTPVDILAVFKGEPVFVQCKSGPWYSVSEWNDFLALATEHCATPIYATKDKRGRIKLYRITEPKDGSRRPMSPDEWEPRAEWVAHG